MPKYLDLYENARASLRKINQPTSATKKAANYYIGFDPNFHKYTIYNGEKTVAMVKKSLRMGKKACEDWASLIWSEKLDLSCKNKEKAVPYLVDIGFWKVGAKAIELGFGIGISCVAVCIEIDADPETGETIPATGKISLEYYSALDIVPLAYEGGEISEVALFSTLPDKGRKMTAFVKDDSGKYVIVVVEEDKDGHRKYADISTNSDVPMFSTFHPNVVDNESVNFHGYASIIQNSIGTIQAMDNAFDGMDNEITLGRKRIFASAATTKILFEKSDGESVSRSVRTFDPNDTVIYSLPETNETENQKPYVYSPNDPLRIEQYTANLTLNMQLFSQQVGLGANYYRFEGGRIMTATQVISQNSDTYRNLKKHEQVIEPAIKRLYRGIAVASQIFTEGSPLEDDPDVAVIFDDSIIEDRATEKESDTKDLQNGIISRTEYRARWRGEDEKDAKKAIDGIMGDEQIVSRFNALAPVISANIVTSKLAVFIIFKGKEELLKEAGYNSIEEYAQEVEEKAKSGTITADDLLGFGPRNESADDGNEGTNP